MPSYSTPGSDVDDVVPIGKNWMKITCFGGGAPGDQAGGGGPTMSQHNMAVDPLTPFHVRVANYSLEGRGENSYVQVNGNVVCLAAGGYCASGNTPGVGGNAADNVGNGQRLSGGSGAAKSSAGGSYYGGGGGGGPYLDFGDYQHGQDANGRIGAPNCGGWGGSANAYTNATYHVNAQNGGGNGGGGGGKATSDSSGGDPGKGGPGLVTIQFDTHD